ncbi:hypothetical protein IFM89_018338 [Coptis chinensis]|uniref:2-hydroxyacyl-CoA lyase n=1 Tax=Coptis chinensis TaxID=261450 RepID=A0A835ITD5_9MAGN|nr:hypothetical protein IFM89_018338 [Coptis chinensis]
MVQPVVLITCHFVPSHLFSFSGANHDGCWPKCSRSNEPRTRLDAGNLGTMGVGAGYCIAAAVASPDALLFFVEGDSDLDLSPWKSRH